jgi:hypothetical protein
MPDSRVVEIPKSLRTLERDRRGLPIPYIVLRDRSGSPIFAHNDARRIAECERKRLCSICGKRLKDLWFVGGSRAFLHEDGVFIDPPVHQECGEYALQVCPFLASPNWGKSVAQHTAKDRELPKGVKVGTPVAYVGPAQPEWFGFGLADRLAVGRSQRGDYLHRVIRWTYVEFWKNGRRCNSPNANQVKELLSSGS